jgi:glutamate--cysteine ligase
VSPAPEGRRLIGVEYERLGVLAESGAALPYEGERSVVTVLESLARNAGWRPVGGPPLIELSRGGSRLTLEPGGQIELSARPHETLAAVGKEIETFLEELRSVSAPLGILWLPLGLQPLSVPEEIAWLPKERYRIMSTYLPGRGRLAPWMMKTTAGMQVNLDLRGEEDAARKLRLALAVGSLVTALFANSPLSGGSENGWASRRARIWMEVDEERCGLPEGPLREDATVEAYLDWALEAGMFFVERQDGLLDLTGLPFARYLAEGAAGQRATLEDWSLHLTTLFPEARLRGYLEVRGTDANRLDRALAHAALWVGLVYGGDEVLREALELTAGWSHEERLRFHREAARHGLAATGPAGRSAADLTAALVELAARGLERVLPEEREALAPAEALAAAGRCPADEVLEGWRGRWGGSVPRLVDELSRVDHD